MTKHEDVKKAVGINCANCQSCAYLGSNGDGGEYEVSWAVCTKKGNEKLNNLKSFPFKTEQKCWHPEFWHSKFTDSIDGSNSSIMKCIEDFNFAIEGATND